MRAFLSTCALAFALMTVSAPLAAAQDPDPAAERSTSFQAVEGPQVQDVPGGTLMVAAYGVIWVLLLLYVLRLGMMQARTAREVERLHSSLARADGGEASGKD